jgi:proteasome beta subunit
MTEGIAGDFFSLLQSRKVPFLNVERGEHAPVQVQATTVFAFHYRDGVLMAGDRRATAGNVIVTDKVDKVIDIDATSILAIAASRQPPLKWRA